MVEANAVPTLLAGAGLVALAAWLHLLPPASRLRRSFALLAFLRGVLMITAALTPRGAPFQHLAVRYAVYLWLVIPLAAIYFALAYHRGGRGMRHAGTAFLALGLGLVAAYMAWPAWFLQVPGPALVLLPLEPLAYLVVAWTARNVPAHDASPTRAPSALLLSLGFALEAAFLAGLHVVTTPLPRRGDAWLWAEWAAWWTAALVVVALLVSYLWLARRASDPSTRRFLHRAPLLMLTAAATGLLAGMANLYRWGGDPYLVRVLLDAVWSLSFVLIVAYALVRYRLFDIHIKIRWTVRQGTLAGIFVAVFFAVSEGAAAAFQTWSNSTSFGIAAAALLLFALQPLQAFAERVAARTVPDAPPTRDLDAHERARLYQDMVRAAWQDGSLSLAEQRVLEVGRARLGLSLDDAHAAERNALASLGVESVVLREPPGPRQRAPKRV